MSYESLVVLLFHAVLAPATAVHALLFKREPRGAFGWIAVCVLFPLAGPVVYLFFGLNRTRSRAQRSPMPGLVARECGDAVQPPLPADLPVPYHGLAVSGRALSRHALVGGNTVEPLFNGEQAYPAMLEAIESARRRVWLTTYLFDNDTTGRRFGQALAAAARRGVDVRVITDGVGEWYALPRASRRLARDGVRTARFLPPGLLPPSLSINLRNHQKILVVDDRLGFTGGMNIGDRHNIEDPDNRRPTADMHFCLSGPIVAQLGQEFRRAWTFCTGEPGAAEAVPEAAAEAERQHDAQDAGDTRFLRCRTMTDGPDEDLDRLTMLLSAAIASARRSIRIMTPYFLPPRELVGALQSAAIRDIDVQIVLPAVNNLPYVHWATRNMLWELLFRNVRVSYQPPPFNHAKLFVVDEYYSLIGSTNWDPRSLRLNFELQIEVYGSALARLLNDYIDRAARAGRQVTLSEVDGRSVPTRLRDAACWLFSPYL